jgi:hypothetical protein
MTLKVADTITPPRNLWRSTGAVLAGVLAVIVLSLVTDELFHMAQVYPPWDQAMHDPRLNLLALSYRCVYNVVGAYITARLAPRNPPRHLWVFALIGFALGTAGAIATIPMNIGPAWYPILLAVSAFPCTWLGWVIYRARHVEARQ